MAITLERMGIVHTPPPGKGAQAECRNLPLRGQVTPASPLEEEGSFHRNAGRDQVAVRSGIAISTIRPFTSTISVSSARSASRKGPALPKPAEARAQPMPEMHQ